MKKLLKNRIILTIVIVFIYIFLACIGLVLISIFPIYNQKGYLDTDVDEVVEAYKTNNFQEIDSRKTNRTHVFIFNPDGSLNYFGSNDTKTYDDFKPYLVNYCSRALNGEYVFALTQSFFSTDITHLMLVGGEQIESNGEILGAVIIVQSLNNFQESIYGFLIYFSLFYIVVVIIFISYRVKQKKLEALKNNYVANITHALKTPIASIRVLTETLNDNPVSDADYDKRHEYYSLILNELKLQSNMVQDILELSKIQSRNNATPKASVNIKPVVSHIKERYSAILEYTDIQMSIPDSFNTLPTLYTNEESLKSIFDILIDNALKYVDEGGCISLNASVSGKTVTFEVWDDGAVISKNDQPHLFERFYQGENAVNSGSGLGLAIVNELCINLEEKVWVKSEDGKGTSFYFTVSTK